MRFHFGTFSLPDICVLLQEFQKKLSTARRIVVVGNGGIATELV